jgi:uncharacterized protein (TIGR03382 family)
VIVARIAFACLAVLAARVAAAQCSNPPLTTEFWTMTFDHVDVDGGYDTTYSLTAPCKVFVDNDFVVTAAVHDNLYAQYLYGRTVGKLWSIWDDPANAATVTLDRGTVVNTDGAGDWVQAITTRYTGTPVNHVIGFGFTPGGGAHFFGPQSIVSSVTADPYPDAPSADPSADALPPAPETSGGCSTVGPGGAALALLGVVAAMRRRRRP